MFSRVLKLISGSPLRNKILLLLIVLSAAPILFLGGITLYLLDLAHRRDVAALEVQLIDQKIEEIEKFLADTAGILELRVGFEQKSEIELSQQRFILDGLLEENRAFEELAFIGRDGRETAKRARTESGAPTSLEDVSRLGYFVSAIRGDNFIGDVSHTLTGPFVIMASPVRNRNGDIIQVLAAEVGLGSVVRAVRTARLGNSGSVILADQNGDFIAQSGAKSLAHGMPLGGWSRMKRILGGEVLTGLEARDRYRSPSGVGDVVGAGKRVPTIGWAILAEWPLDDADAVIRDVRGQIVTFALFVIVAVVLLAPLFARRLLMPIRALKEGTEAIERGDFSQRVDIKTRDELAQLGSAFNRMAEGLRRLQELKNEFVFIAAHELRAPVTAIRGYLSMVFEGSAGPVSGKLKEYLSPVEQAASRLARLVDDILEIARSEAGRIKIQVFALDIRESIRAVVSEANALAVPKKIMLSYDRPKDILLVLADTVRIKEVLMNFVSNAIKYNNEGGWVKIYHESEDGRVITHVEDNGLGLSKDDQEHLFQKFFRATSAKTQMIEGTGLGLFITKELIEKMGGTVWFRSEEGRGTRFSFSLPSPPINSGG
ncbi:MAG: sensor histidine kinase [Patescibacteria group bacterium]